ncbi:MerR family transcriptional regulator [Alicyclobacillus cycloheptanicus]|uniref:MerR family glutamine synthetase transcriptional repressor n=1 Tax=Alicyclobacillus cycloheptanicus TaxID=1457 RepID=A0ABT9XGA9_9BACL|nr:MerR family transcriptional regulator [Alicyclobacillus cycloheptanicus]MDQ0189322.1 MerR family glutamine synthetase transcriptional repressor [Alicyclobacillus cycloheptanicus]WDM01318.1 MerR family transcriptional regulator [Alicyclobacillus cycloheptanicus]
MDLSSRRQLPLFSIGIVQKLTGLTARQIRYYEQHGLIHPARSEGKQRLFSFADVERLMDVRSLLDDGYNMSGVKAKLLGKQPDGAGAAKANDKAAEPSDAELYKWLQEELQAGQTERAMSLFQGDLSRLYRRR